MKHGLVVVVDSENSLLENFQERWECFHVKVIGEQDTAHQRRLPLIVDPEHIRSMLHQQSHNLGPCHRHCPMQRCMTFFIDNEIKVQVRGRVDKDVGH